MTGKAALLWSSAAWVRNSLGPPLGLTVTVFRAVTALVDRDSEPNGGAGHLLDRDSEPNGDAALLHGAGRGNRLIRVTHHLL